jgi:hypothetical protein
MPEGMGVFSYGETQLLTARDYTPPFVLNPYDYISPPVNTTTTKKTGPDHLGVWIISNTKLKLKTCDTCDKEIPKDAQVFALQLENDLCNFAPPPHQSKGLSMGASRRLVAFTHSDCAHAYVGIFFLYLSPSLSRIFCI